MTPADRAGEQRALAVGYIHHTDGYFWAPQRLLDTCIHHPRALGLWTLITRLWIGYGQPTVPLSDNDLHTYGNYAGHGRGTVLDDLAILTKHGFLMSQRQRGKKTHYTPAWGMDRQHQPRPWKRVKGWNRGTTKTVRVSNVLIDAYVGRFIPNATKRGTLDRYTSEPLPLVAVGQYLLSLRGRVAEDCADLVTAGLLTHGEPVPVPTLTTALASRPLTDRGTRRLAHRSLQRPDQASTQSAPLFFWQISMILIMIQHLIPLFGRMQVDSSASASDKTDLPEHDSNPPSMEFMKSSLMDSPLPPFEEQGGGYRDYDQEDSTTKNREPSSTQHPNQPRHRANVMSIPATPTALALRAVNVRPKQILDLADVDHATVQLVIQDAQSRPDVKDVAGWVVSVLRDVRDHGWQIAANRWQIAHAGKDAAVDLERAKTHFGWGAREDMPSVLDQPSADDRPPPTAYTVSDPARAPIITPPAPRDPYADHSAMLQTALKAQLEPRQRGFAHDLQVVARTDTSITLLASNPIAHRWLTQHGMTMLTTALAQCGWTGSQIDLQVRGSRR